MRRFLVLLFCICLLCGCSGKAVNSAEPTPQIMFDEMQVHFIDVGQGDCILILTEGASMLIDSGTSESKERVIAYLKQQGISRLDYVVATHPHEDHIGGMAEVIRSFTVGEFLMPELVSTSQVFSNMLDALEDRDVAVTIPKPGDMYTLGKAFFSVLGPCKTYEDTNDMSVIVRLLYGEKSFLFTGDAEATAEADILLSGAEVKSDVLKAGHHGSSTSSSAAFMEAVEPEYAVISCGKDNSYGHPHRETLEILEDMDITVLRTDQLGSIVLSTDGKQIAASWQQTEGPESTQQCIGNKKSKIVHSSSCSSLPAEKNRIYFNSLNEAYGEGYHACTNCLGGK